MVRLGTDGMSSDESDTEGDGTPVLSIRKKAWRNATTTRWLRDLDIIDLALRVTVPGTIKKGNWPSRRRAVDNKHSLRGPVPKLPRPFYDPRYLRELTEMQVEDLQIEEKDYDFTHPPKVAL